MGQYFSLRGAQEWAWSSGTARADPEQLPSELNDRFSFATVATEAETLEKAGPRLGLFAQCFQHVPTFSMFSVLPMFSMFPVHGSQFGLVEGLLQFKLRT